MNPGVWLLGGHWWCIDHSDVYLIDIIMLLPCVYWHESNCHCSVSAICLLPMHLKIQSFKPKHSSFDDSCSCFVFTYVLFTNLMQETGLHLIPVTLVLSVLAFKPPASLRFCELQWKPKRFIVSTYPLLTFPHVCLPEWSKLYLKLICSEVFPTGKKLWSYETETQRYCQMRWR